MSFSERMEESLEQALKLPLDSDSRYILFSDCHRGDGRADDNFLKNELIYLTALKYYFNSGFTCLELGDGDELWENRSIEKIKEMHPHSFELLEKYHRSGRLYLVYGNHDMVKKEAGEKMFWPDARFYPGIVLEDSLLHKKLFLTHGHQAEVMNSRFWKINRFLVRYLWKTLELLGVPDPTSAAKNHKVKELTENRLTAWAVKHHMILITGHTHRPMTGSEASPYFNTGSCVHPAGITGIEIENRCIVLVKWMLGTKSDQTVYVKREVLGEKVRIKDC